LVAWDGFFIGVPWGKENNREPSRGRHSVSSSLFRWEGRDGAGRLGEIALGDDENLHVAAPFVLGKVTGTMASASLACLARGEILKSSRSKICVGISEPQ
jgi:hypothetical protein